MSSAPFSTPYAYWVGMDTDPRTTPAALAEFDDFYSRTHVHEVMAAHPGFVGVSRYELVTPDPRGGAHHGPRWLAVYEIADEAALTRYLKDNERPWLHRKKYSPWPSARRRAKTVWRLLWQRAGETGALAPGTAPEAVAFWGRDEVDGPNPAESLTGEPTARSTHFARFREFAHPAPGCPAFCEIVEPAPAGFVEPAPAADEAAASPGWQLVYRRIPLPG
jgi:hypothetical protein